MRYWPHVQYGRYQIIEKLGAGGMGAVYRAMALGADGFQKPVVIKRIHGHLAQRPDLLDRFANEAKIAMGMAHGNVVQVLDLGKIGLEYFIALEYVHGRDLRQVFKRCIELKEWLPREIALLIITETLRGLDYAHRMVDMRGDPLGVVHRDVTPANILCSYEGEVKLTDFGIARAMAWTSSTQVGEIRGSVNYMSPEQANGQEVDQRSDIFSVGAVLYVLLCKAKPFPGKVFREVLERVQAVRFLPPSAHGVELPDELETVIYTAMAKEPDDRYQTAGAMLAALESYQRTIQHATSTDLQALIQRLFEQELAGDAQPIAEDDLVGARLEATIPDETLPDVSVYEVPDTDTDTKRDPSTPGLLPTQTDVETVDQRPSAMLETASETSKLEELLQRSDRRHRRVLLTSVAAAAMVTASVVAGVLIFRTGADAPEERTAAKVKTRTARILSPSTSMPALAKSVPLDGATTTPAPDRTVSAPDARSPQPIKKRIKPRSAKRRPTPARQGWVRISTRPAYAEVYLGGRRLDTTPCRVSLPAGTHRLRLINPKLGLRVTRKVVVRAGAETQLMVKDFE